MREQVGKKRQRYADDFKQAAVARFSCTEDVEAFARELGINRSLLYKWTVHLSEETAAAVRRSPSLKTELAVAGFMAIEVARLTGRIGTQNWPPATGSSFFRATLQRDREPRQRKGVPGEIASTR